MKEKGVLNAAISETQEIGDYVAHRRDLQKLYLAQLLVLLSTVVAVTYTINVGVLSLMEGMVILAVISVIEQAVERHVAY